MNANEMAHQAFQSASEAGIALVAENEALRTELKVLHVKLGEIAVSPLDVDPLDTMVQRMGWPSLVEGHSVELTLGSKAYRVTCLSEFPEYLETDRRAEWMMMFKARFGNRELTWEERVLDGLQVVAKSLPIIGGMWRETLTKAMATHGLDAKGCPIEVDQLEAEDEY